jgi:hypothetical protein
MLSSVREQMAVAVQTPPIIPTRKSDLAYSRSSCARLRAAYAPCLDESWPTCSAGTGRRSWRWGWGWDLCPADRVESPRAGTWWWRTRRCGWR